MCLIVYVYSETYTKQDLSLTIADSVIFVGPADPTQETIPTGEYLGALTDELPPGTWITEFVSGGAKNYGYKLSNGELHMTVKGITLNSRNAEVVTFETLKSMVLGTGPATVHVTDPTKFVRDPITATIKSVPYTKSYRVVYDKRRVVNDFRTLPFGYKGEKEF